MDSVHDGHRERLRERYAEDGLDGFQDHQVLELLLTYAIPRKDTNELAHLLLEQFGSLEAVLAAEVPQLMRVPGIGKSTAVFLHMQCDVSHRVAMQRLRDRQGRIKLATPHDSARFAAALLSREAYETVYAVCLNKLHVVQQYKNLATGSLVEAPIYPRQIVEYALLNRAHSIVLIHNHPSGNPSPSKEDCDVTATVRAALTSVDIPLLDHLITGGQYVYSFSANMVVFLQGHNDTPVSMTLDEYAARMQAISQSAASRLGEPYGSRPLLRFVKEREAQ